MANSCLNCINYRAIGDSQTGMCKHYKEIMLNPSKAISCSDFRLPLDVGKALKAVVEHGNEPSLKNALPYAQRGLFLKDGEQRRTQCLFVLDNISNWKSELADQVKDSLNKYVRGA